MPVDPRDAVRVLEVLEHAISRTNTFADASIKERPCRRLLAIAHGRLLM